MKGEENGNHRLYSYRFIHYYLGWLVCGFYNQFICSFFNQDNIFFPYNFLLFDW